MHIILLWETQDLLFLIFQMIVSEIIFHYLNITSKNYQISEFIFVLDQKVRAGYRSFSHSKRLRVALKAPAHLLVYL